ncbi:unnamed protein product (macronuclear) [Paramecium tetraurelia]|uniref:RING-type domain-containing protein n=1 Tax=Paramecium tetraurelia TaxID=5888 RepID=A0DQD3_PARTE|nr:uncharacterized protein GSPATT00002650001 [Paramecium tetraurelia]CAK85250.1 unnamed protein product [Paramecium tetraurelia]|eukprot:XP_001452647.1 hypothetical protein (macronuclear) [Paramecium tetraurelia strain d4-2]
MFLYLFYFFVTGLGIKEIYINQDYFYQGKFYNLEDSEYSVVQEVEQGTLLFQITKPDCQKYLQIELIFTTPTDGDVNSQFTINQNSPPSVLGNKSLNATYTDMNGDYLHKSYQNIVIPPLSYKQGDKFYITNLIREEGKTYSYKIRISQSNDVPCPNKCTSDSLGSCQFGSCSCKLNRVDLDCSKMATPILVDNKMENVTISGTQYFYFQQKTQLETIQLDLEFKNVLFSQHSSIFVYIMFENFVYGVATSQFNNYTYSLSQDSTTLTISDIIPVKQLNHNQDLQRFNRLLLTFVVPGTSDLNINISLPSPDAGANINQILIYLLVSLAAILVLTWIIITLIRCRRNNRTRIFPFPQQAPLEIQKQQINLEQFDYYMVKIPWSQLDHHPFIIEKKIDYNQFEGCSICLSEYGKDSVCRVTPCIHVFHADCLLEWLKNQKINPSCPMCRDEFTEQKLEEFAQQMNDYKKAQQQKKKSIVRYQNENSLLMIQDGIQPLSQ